MLESLGGGRRREIKEDGIDEIICVNISSSWIGHRASPTSTLDSTTTINTTAAATTTTTSSKSYFRMSSFATFIKSKTHLPSNMLTVNHLLIYNKVPSSLVQTR